MTRNDPMLLNQRHPEASQSWRWLDLLGTDRRADDRSKTVFWVTDYNECTLPDRLSRRQQHRISRTVPAPGGLRQPHASEFLRPDLPQSYR